VSDFSFNNLNLESVEFSSVSSVLEPGRHVCRVDSAELKDTRTGGKQVVLQLGSTEGKGNIRAWINVFTPSSKQATDIGREQLKALLTHGGHPNPNHPGDINTLQGLVVGVGVSSDTYMKDGQERTGSTVSYFFDPAQASKPVESSKPAEAPAPTPKDDEIPF